MKKIFVMIICAMALASCGTMANLENSPYVADAYATSFDKDMAYTKAYDKAMGKISEKFSIVVKTDGSETYEGFETNKGTKEVINTFHSTKTESKVDASDVVVTRVKYSKTRKNGWECYVVVKVSENNLQ